MSWWGSLPEQGFNHRSSTAWAGQADCGVPMFEYGVRSQPAPDKPRCTLCEEIMREEAELERQLREAKERLRE